MNRFILLATLVVFISCADLKKEIDTNNQYDNNKNTAHNDSASNMITYSCDYLGQDYPQNLPELFSPNFISTNVEHSAVMITPTGNEMWFGRMYPAKIWYLEKVNDKWSDIKKAPLDDNFHYLYPFLSPDGNKMYFTSDRPIIPGKERKHRSEGDIWYIERQAGGWSEPVHLGDKINFGNRHSIGSVSASGNMYFTVRTGTRYNPQTKIYFSEYKDGKYSDPMIIKELDSDQPSHSPFVAPDESYLIHSSFRGGYGMSDLFISFKDSTSRWTHPKNLGSSINSDAKEEYPYISPDGEYLFFNSSRISEINKTKIQNGPGNMYWVQANFIEGLRKQLD